MVDDGGQRNCLVRHFAGVVMKRLTVAFPFLVFLFLPAQVCAQSPFDGTWLIKSDTGKLPGDFRFIAGVQIEEIAERLHDRNTVELTQKRGESIISVRRLSVSADGKSIHAVFESKLNKTSSSFEMEKQP